MLQKKEQDPSYLLGQLIGTAQCIEEALKAKVDPMDNSLTVSEECFNEMIENPASTLRVLYKELERQSEPAHHLGRDQLIKEMELIQRLAKKYNFHDEHLDEDAYFKGYYEQLKKHQKV